ncbi:MAG: sodium:alanine symporter family protein [Verrucomicrobia bacterium]|nr:sodium:alanine symporter family protein [Verrucomicrobiota bacterium]
MFLSFFDYLARIDAFFWGYLGFSCIAILGCYFTVKSGFFQFRALPSIFRTFWYFLKYKSSSGNGTHPLKVFFTSVGGMIGVGNVAGIVTALQIGGPGALFWVWIAAFLGSLIKYSEVYLGLKYRVANDKGGYDGGSIHFLKKAFQSRFVGMAACVLLCIYAAEVYQFSVLTHCISVNWQIDHLYVVIGFLALILYTVLGGIKRVGRICSTLMPVFTLLYIAMGIYVIAHHIPELPGLIGDVFRSAFTGHAGLGGFAGSTIMLSMQQGISRAVYAADIGIGYDSIIQSETNAAQIENQARLSMLGVFLDNLVCTCTLLIALTSGFWKAVPTLDPALVVQSALAVYFPGQAVFMPIFLFVLVYTTLISYLFVGFKCARFLHPRHGEKIYFVFAIAFLAFFSFFDQSKALLAMSLAGCLLLCLNLTGIYKLRKEIEFPLFVAPEGERAEVEPG